MNSPHGRAKTAPFIENKETLLFWERALFGETFLSAAFQVRHRDSARFYKEMSHALEACSSKEEATELGLRIKGSVGAYVARATGCQNWVQIQLMLQRRAERDLDSERIRRAATGRPCFFDRRSETWVNKDSWHRVPYIDDKIRAE